MIEVVKHTTVVFTDHAANTSIVKQITLTTSNTDKLNLRLIRASFYLSQFDLKIKYRLDKNHIVLDALSRLSSENDSAIDRIISAELNLSSYYADIDDFSNDSDSYVMQSIIIVMFDEFRVKIIEGYFKDQM